jgi:30S ribosomal protein S31
MLANEDLIKFAQNFSKMGKGDIKSKRGKIGNKSYGVRRPKKSKSLSSAEIATAKAEKAIQAAKTEKPKAAKKEVEATEKPAAAKKASKAKA